MEKAMCRINPKIDIAFRKLFGSEENKDILMAFINSVLPKKDQIKSLELKNPYNLATYISGKGGILDIKAIGNDGRYFDVEMQIGEQKFFGKRIKYYLDKIYVDQLEESEQYSSLKKVIGIAILDFNYFADNRYKRGLTYKDIETNQIYDNFDLSDIYFIELKKFGKDLQHLTNALDRWITFLNKAHQYDKNNIPQELALDEFVAKAITKLDIMYLENAEREIYENEKKARLDKLEELQTAKIEGLQEGIEQGIKQGIKQGKAEGEKQKAIEIAKEMLLDGINIEKIQKFTGLSEKKIKKISNK